MATKQPVSTVPNGKGENVTIPDAELNTAADPKTANGDEVRKERGISASATAEQVLANGGVDTIDHDAKPTMRPDTPAAPDAEQIKGTGKGVDVRVLSGITIAGVRYEPNDVVTGLPESFAKDHAEAFDTDAAAVAYARELGMPVRAFGKAE